MEVRNLSRIKILLFALALLFVSTSSSYAETERRYVRLTILHTNDTHAHLLPFNYPAVVTNYGKEQKLPAYRNIGGIARRATLIKQIKHNTKGPVLVMDTGDLLDGSPFSLEFQGEADIEAMNATGYDVMTVGNHEFNNNISDFRKRQHEALFPLLGANVFQTKDGQPFLQPYVIKDVDGLKVAVLGLTTQVNYMDGVSMKDAVSAAREWIPKLRSQADAVILLSHLGYDEDAAIACQVPGIDAIIGGHSHTRLEKPILISGKQPASAFWVGGTVIAQDFQWGGELGCVELIFRKGDSGCTLMSYSGRLIPITNSIPEDPAVHRVVDNYYRKIAKKYDRVVCQAESDFTGEAPANLLCDILRTTFNTDFCIAGSGRSDLVAGPITMADVTEFFPFNNTVVTFDISGSDLKQVLSKHAPNGTNLEYSVKGTTLIDAKIGGKDIEDGKTYSGVANSYLAWCYLPRNVKVTETGKNVRDTLVQYLEAKKVISPDSKPRIRYID